MAFVMAQSGFTGMGETEGGSHSIAIGNKVLWFMMLARLQRPMSLGRSASVHYARWTWQQTRTLNNIDINSCVIVICVSSRMHNLCARMCILSTAQHTVQSEARSLWAPAGVEVIKAVINCDCRLPTMLMRTVLCCA